MSKVIVKIAEGRGTHFLTICLLVALSTLSHVCGDTKFLNIKNLIVNIDLISAILFIALALYIRRVWKTHKATLSLRDVIVSLTSGGLGISGIISMIAFLIGVGWLTDDLREGKYYLAIHSLGLIGVISGLYALSITSKKKRNDKIYPTKVLFSALSYRNDLKDKLKPENGIPLIKKFFSNMELLYGQSSNPMVGSKVSFEAPLGNLLLSILWRLKQFKLMHSKKLSLYLLISNEIDETKLHLDFETILKRVAKEVFESKVEIEFYFSDPVDFNDYQSISQELECMLGKALRKYDEKDIAFNISLGTSAVTSAMIIAALKEARQIEYITQHTDPIQLKAFDITEEEILRFGILQKNSF